MHITLTQVSSILELIDNGAITDFAGFLQIRDIHRNLRNDIDKAEMALGGTINDPHSMKEAARIIEWTLIHWEQCIENELKLAESAKIH